MYTVINNLDSTMTSYEVGGGNPWEPILAHAGRIAYLEYQYSLLADVQDWVRDHFTRVVS